MSPSLVNTLPVGPAEAIVKAVPAEFITITPPASADTNPVPPEDTGKAVLNVKESNVLIVGKAVAPFK